MLYYEEGNAIKITESRRIFVSLTTNIASVNDLKTSVVSQFYYFSNIVISFSACFPTAFYSTAPPCFIGRYCLLSSGYAVKSLLGLTLLAYCCCFASLNVGVFGFHKS